METTEPYKFKAHAPKKVKFMPWSVCWGCGLVFLHNSLTSWCVTKGCNYQDHPEYAKQVKKNSGL